MFKKYLKALFPLLLTSFPLLSLILTTFIITATASSGILFGPKKYQRTSGPPNKYTDTFQAAGRNGSLIVKNGDAGSNSRVTSAVIYLNGKEIFGPA